MSTIMIPRIQNFVLYLIKLVDFNLTHQSNEILRIFANIIAISDSSKINDLILDLILKEEKYFKINHLLLNSHTLESYGVIERFVKGISRVLQSHNMRMVKKKFYQIFSIEVNDLEQYF